MEQPVVDTAVLGAMMAELERAPRLYHPGKYWERLNHIHAERIVAAGLGSFKRSINLKYFNWRIGPILFQQFGPVVAELLRGNLSPFLHADFPRHKPQLGIWAKGFGPISAYIYKVFIAALADYLARHDPLRLLDSIEEPSVGNPFLVTYRGRRLSQDLLNSVHEFYSATEAVDPTRDIHTALDIGAGYGRLAYVFLRALPSASFCIVDIPPALYISQEYLSAVFPGEPVFRFRPFRDFNEIRREFESSRIQFLMAHQIELLPSRMFDLVINASSFQEMRRDQIAHYVRQIARIGRGFFYTKQWQRSHVKDNDFITEMEYPVPAAWREVYRRRHGVQREYFEALYQAHTPAAARSGTTPVSSLYRA